MPTYGKISSIQRKCTTAYRKENGNQRKLKSCYGKVNGTWRRVLGGGVLIPQSIVVRPTRNSGCRTDVSDLYSDVSCSINNNVVSVYYYHRGAYLKNGWSRVETGFDVILCCQVDLAAGDILSDLYHDVLGVSESYSSYYLDISPLPAPSEYFSRKYISYNNYEMDIIKDYSGGMKVYKDIYTGSSWDDDIDGGYSQTKEASFEDLSINGKKISIPNNIPIVYDNLDG